MARPQRRARRFDSRRRRKVSILTKEKIDYVDYKDVTLLRRFISDRAKIRPRRVTGNNEQQQRAVALAIKNAREMALLPYENRITTQRRSSDRRSYEPDDAREGTEAGSAVSTEAGDSAGSVAGSESAKAGDARPGDAGGIPAPPRMPQTAAQDKEPEAAEPETAEPDAAESENDALAAESSESQSEEGQAQESPTPESQSEASQSEEQQ